MVKPCCGMRWNSRSRPRGWGYLMGWDDVFLIASSAFAASISCCTLVRHWSASRSQRNGLFSTVASRSSSAALLAIFGHARLSLCLGRFFLGRDLCLALGSGIVNAAISFTSHLAHSRVSV